MTKHPIISATLLFLASLNTEAVILSTKNPIPYQCDSCERLSHDPLSMQWPVASKIQLTNEAQHQQRSKKYSLNVTFKELEQGVNLYTLAPGAVIRIYPLPSLKKNQQASDFKPVFTIKTKQTPALPLQEASSLLAQDTNLDNSFSATHRQTILQLKPELGAGKITLQASPVASHEADQFSIHVFDKNASSTLIIETNKAHYEPYERLTTNIRLADATQTYPLLSVTASLINPEGKRTPLTLKQQPDKHYTATIPLHMTHNYLGKNWYIATQATAELGGQPITREAHTAFSYAIPSALIHEIKQDESSSFTFTASLKVATGSRYALQAILFTENAEGKKTPLKIIQSSAWLSPGDHDLIFSLMPEEKVTPTSKFYLGAIQLIDYGQIRQVFRYNAYIPINSV